MSDKQHFFTQKKEEIVSLDKGKFIKVFIIGTVLFSIIGFTGYQLYSVGSKFVKAKDALLFAYQYPELVDPVAEQYRNELSSLKDSIVKRQSMNLMLDELKKE